MALYSGIDPVAFVSGGVYTETYGSSDGGNIASLFVSYGLVEDASGHGSASLPGLIKIIGSGFKKLIG